MRAVRVLRVLAVLGAAALLLPLAGPASAASSPAGRIAFTADLSGSWQLWTARPDGSDLRQVTHLRGGRDANLFQSWSPDGRQLLFSSSTAGTSDLYRVRADGTGLRRITSGPPDDFAPSWSPDGARIAFARVVDGGNAAIYTADLDGTHVRRLTSPTYDSFLPLWTPDGQHLVFGSTRGGLVSAVWVMRVDGTQAHRITPAALQGFPFDVSPDGREVLLADNGNADLPTSLYTVHLDGTGLRRLTDAGCCFKDSNARFSPDGRRIAFTTDRGYPTTLDQDEVWIMTADGRDLHPVTSSLTPRGCPDELVDNCVGPVDWSRAG